MIVRAKCTKCGYIMESTKGGHWVGCPCGKSFVDRDRWFPDRIRLGGDAELLPEETNPKGEKCDNCSNNHHDLCLNHGLGKPNTFTYCCCMIINQSTPNQPESKE